MWDITEKINMDIVRLLHYFAATGSIAEKNTIVMMNVICMYIYMYVYLHIKISLNTSA